MGFGHTRILRKCGEQTSPRQLLKVLPQLFLPVGHVEPDRLELGQVERGVDRAQGDGALGAGVVVGVADWHDPVAIAAGGLEGGWGNVRQHIIAPEPVQQ